ncbi:MAG: SDR family oxidoreductase [Myxococcota bacterium]|nr:SDR family oxidoreductase [Myxococcota bacterium]
MNDASMAGRVCLVTGSTNGIGRSAAETLARRGASVVMLARNRGRGERARDEIRSRTGNDDVTLLLADLSSQAQIRRAAAEFLALDRPLHVLLNNAGVVNRVREETEDGIEATFAVNHLAYFQLTNLLLDRMKRSAPGRIVNVSSDAHRFAGALDFDDLEARGRYAFMTVYGRSKLANILFTRELARRLEGSEVTANCLHPGFVGSNFAANNGTLAAGLMRLLRPFARSTEKGAETAVYLCTAADVEGKTGGYYYDCKPHAPRETALRDEDASRLWDVSLRMTAGESA